MIVLATAKMPIETIKGEGTMKVVVNGAGALEDVPGLSQIADRIDLVIAPDSDRLGQALPGADVLLAWNMQSRDMHDHWQIADSLKWIHWCGAGVDGIMSPELAASDIQLTNARGVFDDVMAEYILAYMLSESMHLRETFELQKRHEWKARMMSKLAGSTALIYGVGSIGRTTARLLGSVGVQVFGVGRSARLNDPDFHEVFKSGKEGHILSRANWVIGLMPLTPQTESHFDADLFARMDSRSRFLNLGRGESVDEEALIAALNEGAIAGAMLDVFRTEPLDPKHPLWRAPNIVISPHSSSYYAEYEEDMVKQFLENLDRFRSGEPLENVVDKSLGFVPSSA